MTVHKSTTLLTTALVWLALTGLTAGHALAQDTPSATVDFEEESFRLMLGGEKGQGMLHFQGKDYPFTLTGITAGGVGYSDVKAQGEVYGLNDVADFPGTYAEASAGVTAGKGSSGIWMKNSNGVSMQITTSTEGLQLSLGAGGMAIEMTE